MRSKHKILIFIIFNIFYSNILISQGFIQIKPDNPIAGDKIYIIYEPNLSTYKLTEAFYVRYVNRREKLLDLELTKKGNQYFTEIQTDTSDNLIVLNFKNDGLWDNNNNNGYLLHLKSDTSYKINSFSNAANYFDFYGKYKFGMKNNDIAVIENYEKEFSLFPESKIKYLNQYLNVKFRNDSANAIKIIKKELYNLIDKQNKNISEYENIIELYTILKNNDSVNYYYNLRFKNIPIDIYNINDVRKYLINKYTTVEKENLLFKYLSDTLLLSNERLKNDLVSLLQNTLYEDYLNSKNWYGIYTILKYFKHEKGLDYLYYKAAKKSNTFKSIYSDYFYKNAIYISKHILDNPGEIPNIITESENKKYNLKDYGFYCIEYSKFLYDVKNYTEAFNYAKEATFFAENENNISYNSHFSKIAKEVVESKSYIKYLENFIKKNKEDSIIINLFKDEYYKLASFKPNVKQYIDSLKYDSREEAFLSVSSNVINLKAPDIKISTLNRNINLIEKYKNKVIIVDFWASWCKPCIESFPTMNNIIKKYKNDSSIVFLFINSFQNKDFSKMSTINLIKQYDFISFFDEGNKISNLYNVTELPVKFIINKNGYIKYIKTGYHGSQELENELELIIKYMRTKSNDY